MCCSRIIEYNRRVISDKTLTLYEARILSCFLAAQGKHSPFNLWLWERTHLLLPRAILCIVIWQPTYIANSQASSTRSVAMNDPYHIVCKHHWLSCLGVLRVLRTYCCRLQHVQAPTFSWTNSIALWPCQQDSALQFDPYSLAQRNCKFPDVPCYA